MKTTKNTVRIHFQDDIELDDFLEILPRRVRFATVPQNDGSILLLLKNKQNMTEQKFYDYIYDSVEDCERVERDIEKLSSEGWLIKHFHVYERNHFTRIAILFEKLTIQNQENNDKD